MWRAVHQCCIQQMLHCWAVVQQRVEGGQVPNTCMCTHSYWDGMYLPVGYHWIYPPPSPADTASIQDHPRNPSEGFGFLLQKHFVGPQKTNKQTNTDKYSTGSCFLKLLKIWKPTPSSSEEQLVATWEANTHTVRDFCVKDKAQWQSCSRM